MCKLNRTSAYYTDLKKRSNQTYTYLKEEHSLVFSYYVGTGDNFTASMQR